MDNPTQHCPKCGGEFTLLEGGLRYCSKCGFEGEPAKPAAGWARRLQILFWILLVAPSAMALMSYSAAQFAHGSNNFGVTIGLGGMVMGVIGAIYCGSWLARRFGRSALSRTFLGLVAIVGIGVVNFFIVAVGCTPNINFH